MKLIKVFVLVVLLGISSFAKDEKMNINFKNLKIMDLIKITSKIIDKNILFTSAIQGNVDFISNKPVSKDELIKILIYTLESKGFTIVTNENILRIVPLSNSVKSTVPVAGFKNKSTFNQMVTEIFNVDNANVDYIASKIRHLITKNAKLVSNKEANNIVLTDFQDNINMVKKVVRVMTAGAKKSMEIINLKNIQSSDAKINLDSIAKSIFNKNIEKEKVTVIANKSNNSIVLIGTRLNINYLKKYIKKIDSDKSLVKTIVEVYPLKNIEAVNVNKIIGAIIGKKKYIDVADRPLTSVNEETNSIVLMGPSNEIEYLKDLLKKLDKDKAQVYVRARIIEVKNDLIDKVGVKYGILGADSGNIGLTGLSSSLNGGNPLDALSNISKLNLPIPDLKTGLALSATISLLSQNNALDIISEPSILAINNKESSIYVGETVSIKTSSTTTDGGNTNDNYKREDIGLTLKVKPRISSDNKVTLDINATLENVRESSSGDSKNPDTSKKEVKTTAIVNNGEPVIVGGLIENKKESGKSKIPGLGDIPLLGRLFTYDNKSSHKNNLVIIITPYIIPKSKDLTYVRNELAQLKLLEGRFLKETLISLKQKQLEDKKRQIGYSQKLKALDKSINSFGKPSLKSNTRKKKLTNEERQKQKLKKYFGI